MPDIYTIIAYIVILLIAYFRLRVGFKRGFVGEVANTFSMAAALAVGYVLYRMVMNYLSGSFGKIAAGLLYLSIILAVYKVINLIFKSLKLFTKLPVIKGIDKILGALLGIIEAVIIVMVINNIIGINIYDKELVNDFATKGLWLINDIKERIKTP